MSTGQTSALQYLSYWGNGWVFCQTQGCRQKKIIKRRELQLGEGAKMVGPLEMEAYISWEERGLDSNTLRYFNQ